jgi:hypothetical protein
MVREPASIDIDYSELGEGVREFAVRVSPLPSGRLALGVLVRGRAGTAVVDQLECNSAGLTMGHVAMVDQTFRDALLRHLVAAFGLQLSLPFD